MGQPWSVPLCDVSNPIAVDVDARSLSSGTAASSRDTANVDTGCGIVNWLFSDCQSQHDANELDIESEARSIDAVASPLASHSKGDSPAWCCGVSCCSQISCACCKKHGQEYATIDARSDV